jgi:hypothetical protein
MFDSIPSIPRTRHFQARCQQRGLRPQTQALLMTWGRTLQVGSSQFTTLLRRDLPPELRETEDVRRAEDWILVTMENGSLVTCYHQRDAWRFLQQKRSRLNGGR